MANVTIRDPEHWHELRKVHVGASEVGSLFPGVDPFRTPYELYHLKAGNIPEPDLSGNNAVRFGQVFEAGTAQLVAEETGWNLQKVWRYITSDSVEGMGATLDYEAIGFADRGAGSTQIKVIGRTWKDRKVPLVYLLQVQHEMAVTGRDWGALGVAFLDRREVGVFEFQRHDGVIAKLEREITEFWESIREGREPEPDFERDLEAIRRRYRTTHKGQRFEPATDEERARLAMLAGIYHGATAAKTAADKARKAAQAEILTIIGDHGFAAVNEFKVSTWDVPEAPVEAYTRAGYRSMRVTKPKGQGRA